MTPTTKLTSARFGGGDVLSQVREFRRDSHPITLAAPPTKCKTGDTMSQNYHQPATGYRGGLYVALLLRSFAVALALAASLLLSLTRH